MSATLAAVTRRFTSAARSGWPSQLARSTISAAPPAGLPPLLALLRRRLLAANPQTVLTSEASCPAQPDLQPIGNGQPAPSAVVALDHVADGIVHVLSTDFGSLDDDDDDDAEDAHEV